MKKQIKFLSIISMMIMITFYGCKKEDEAEQETGIVEITTGTTTIIVDIPDNVSTNDIEITNFTQTENLDNAENLNISNQTSVLAAMNKTSGEIIYIGMYTKDNKKSTQSTEIELNSKETAIYLILQMLPIPYYELPPDKLDELKQTIENLPGFVQFQHKVASNIADIGSLAIEAIADGVIDILKDAKSCFNIFGIDLKPELNELIAATGTSGTVDPAAPYLKVTKGGGFQVEVKSTTYIQSTKKWKLNCTFYSRKPLFYGITTGVKSSDGNVSYDKDDIPYMMKPFNASAFYKSFSSCSGVANYFGDIRRAITDGADADITFDMAKTSDVEIEIANENDVLCIVAPQKNLRVGITNMARMLTTALMLFNKPESKDKFDTFITKLALKQSVIDAFTTSQLEYEDFKKLTGIMFDELIDFLKDKNNFKDIVYEAIDVDNAKALEKYMKKVNLMIKVAKVTSDMWMALYTWEQSKSYYFEFGFPLKELNAHFEPIVNSTNVPVNTNILIEWDELVEENDNNIVGNQIALYEYYTWKGIPLGNKTFGQNGNTTRITFTPTQELQAETKYFVLVQPKAYRDANGILYDGIYDKDTWSFTTETATNLPTVTTDAASSITQTTATSGGNIAANGGATVTARGVCWATSSSPTTANSYTTDGSGTGTFTSSITGLAAGTTYYVRAYAINSQGTAYGSEQTLTTTSGTLETGTLSDYDNNTYNTVKIGNQWWMAENLKVTHYANGTAIPLVTDNTAWVNLDDNNTDKAYCFQNNNANGEADTYGALYTWAAAMNSTSSSTANPSGIQGICPTGWHLPSDAEWTELTDYLTNNAYGYEGSGTDIAKSMAATSGWTTSSTAGHVGNDQATNNTSGFTALPSSSRSYLYPGFSSPGFSGYWWSATDTHYNYLYTDRAWVHALSYNKTEVYRTSGYAKSYGFSVRCLRD